jgi:hypothetical protein
MWRFIPPKTTIISKKRTVVGIIGLSERIQSTLLRAVSKLASDRDI